MLEAIFSEICLGANLLPRLFVLFLQPINNHKQELTILLESVISCLWYTLYSLFIPVKNSLEVSKSCCQGAESQSFFCSLKQMPHTYLLFCGDFLRKYMKNKDILILIFKHFQVQVFNIELLVEITFTLSRN